MGSNADERLPRERFAGRDPLRCTANWSSRAAADASIKFGRFRLLLRRRRLLADGVPVELGTRAFDLLLVLLEADGALLTKEELLNRVWPDIVVSEENLKVQIFALRKALGADRDLIRTEFGRGYRFIAAVRSTSPSGACRGPRRRERARHQRIVPPMHCSRAFADGWCIPRSLSQAL